MEEVHFTKNIDRTFAKIGMPCAKSWVMNNYPE